MSNNKIIVMGTIIGSMIGGYIPYVWESNGFSMASVITTAVGGIIGTWIGLKLR